MNAALYRSPRSLLRQSCDHKSLSLWEYYIKERDCGTVP